MSIALCPERRERRRVLALLAILLGVGLLCSFYGLFLTAPQSDTLWADGGFFLAGIAALFLLTFLPWKIVGGIFITAGFTCALFAAAGASHLVAGCALTAGISAVVAFLKFFDQ